MAQLFFFKYCNVTGNHSLCQTHTDSVGSSSHPHTSTQEHLSGFTTHCALAFTRRKKWRWNTKKWKGQCPHFSMILGLFPFGIMMCFNDPITSGQPRYINPVTPCVWILSTSSPLISSHSIWLSQERRVWHTNMIEWMKPLCCLLMSWKASKWKGYGQ